jgi:hypothetical protein
MNNHICDTLGMYTHHYDLYTLFNFTIQNTLVMNRRTFHSKTSLDSV